jgi:hypothetical protein
MTECPEPQPLPPDLVPASAELRLADVPDNALNTPCDDDGDDLPRKPTASELDLLVRVAVGLQKRFPKGMPAYSPNELRDYSGRMVSTYPSNWSIAGVTGGCFDTAGLAAWLQISPTPIRRRVAAGTIFTPRINRRNFFPSFQFDVDGTVVPNLFELIDHVRPVFTDDVEMAGWLSRWPMEPSPAALLRDGNRDAAFARGNLLVQKVEEK